MKKSIFLFPLVGMALSSCSMIDDAVNALEYNRYTIESSTDAINANTNAIEQTNRAIEENRRQIDATNQVLEKVSKS
jgi:hypothetical protein